MKSTAILRDEHEVILSALDVLARHVEELRGGAPFNPEFAAWIIAFIRQFADDQHHGKEEGVFFPLLERRGLPRQAGPIAVMLAEHEQGRSLLNRMDESGSRREPAAFAEAAAGYTSLLRQHIAKENQVLFAMAEELLTPEDDAGALEEFGRVVHEGGGVLIRQRYLPAIDRWRQAFGCEKGDRFIFPAEK
jgi:hemerythrin-like domain-containing protein